MLVGYARVSTDDQDTGLQIRALKSAGVTRIFEEKGSGVGPRPQLQLALARLKPGDTLIVWKLDRLARSLADLLGILDRLQLVGASIKSITEPIDTGTPIGSFVIQILGAVAELERNIIRERTLAGVRAARARGAVLGRAPVITDDQRLELVQRWRSGVYTRHQLRSMYGISDSTFYRVTRDRKR